MLPGFSFYMLKAFPSYCIDTLLVFLRVSDIDKCIGRKLNDVPFLKLWINCERLSFPFVRLMWATTASVCLSKNKR